VRAWGRSRLASLFSAQLTWEESKANLALFAVTSSPLILGNDPREGRMQARLVQLLCVTKHCH
jgi:hypothetical protein